MTRKLTDEQVKAIRKLRTTSKNGVIIPHSKNHDFLICKMSKKDSLKNYWYFASNNLPIGIRYIETADEAIAYAEHLLNQRGSWLPQQQSWIMSGEVYTFANGGGNKLLELSLIAWQNGFKEDEEDWFFAEFNNDGRVYQEIHGGFPSVELIKGITIPADSPIWDAVKGVE